MSRYQELMTQIKSLTQEAEKARKDELSGGIAEIKQRMAELGITVEDLAGGKRAGRKRGPMTKKFRDPKSGAEWSGAGRQPKWVQAHLASGGSLDDLRIGAPAAEPKAAAKPAAAKPVAAKSTAKSGAKGGRKSAGKKAA